MLEHNNVVKTSNGLFRVSMDCSTVEGPLDYELTNVASPKDRFMVSTHTVKRSFKSGRWKKVNLD